MKKLSLLLVASLLLTGCLLNQFFTIKHLTREFPAVEEAVLVDIEPHNAYYMGKMKVVPSDESLSYNRNKALQYLLKDAAKVGANYVYLKGITITNSDYKLIRWDTTWGDGVTMEAELYH